MKKVCMLEEHEAREIGLFLSKLDELIVMANIMKKQKKIPEAKSGCFQPVEPATIVIKKKIKRKSNINDNVEKVVDAICKSN